MVPGPFLLNFGSVFGTQKKQVAKKSSKKAHLDHMQSLILESNLAPFFDDCWVNFLIRFLDHFWTHFGPIVGAKIEPKSTKN